MAEAAPSWDISQQTKDITLRLARDVIRYALNGRDDWRFLAELLMPSLNACAQQIDSDLRINQGRIDRCMP